jgi:LCP family protein required for cell wall assembly
MSVKNNPVRPFRIHPAALILLAVGALCFSAAALWQAYFIPPDFGPGLNPPDLVNRPYQAGEDPAAEGGDAQTGPDDAEGGNPAATPTTAGRKPGAYTVLIAGTHDGNLTDTIMMCMLNTKDHTLNVVSIPRDTKVNAKRSLKKINGAYGTHRKKNDPASGALGMRGEVASLIGYPADCYAVIDMKAFKELVDAIGGVTFDVPIDMRDPWGTEVNLKKGEQLLDGDKALMLMRYRSYSASRAEAAGVSGTDDFGRIEMQQRFLKTVAKQMLQLKNVAKINDFVKIASENLNTDLDLREMGWFAQELLKVDAENMTFATLPVVAGGKPNYYCYVKPEEALEMVNRMVNPFERDITAENVVYPTN